MRRRQAARLLIINSSARILLFRFIASFAAPNVQSYWGTPGGGLDMGESFEQAAIRELLEETGISVNAVGPEVGRREVVLTLPTGERVLSDERYFLVRPPHCKISTAGWTPEERDVTIGYRWWSLAELRSHPAVVQPDNLVELFDRIEGR
ncbi:NUDIX hydrolase [Paraburkholderia fungorum]|uniref:NUDIX hydrolase n=1 Tax=Paraburkholderia fungorum TaxID=134537 RepID=UPI00402BA149